MDGGSWQATIHRVIKSSTQLEQLNTHMLYTRSFFGAC